MQLTGAERDLFLAACADSRNTHAQQLLNVFGTEEPQEVLFQLHHAPLGVFVDIASNIWFAIIYEATQRDRVWGDILERVTR